MVAVDAGTLLLGTNRETSRRLVVVAVAHCLFASATALGGQFVAPAARTVVGYGFLVLVPLATLFAVGIAYRNQALAVCWLLASTPVFGAVFNGVGGVSGAYPTLGEWFVMGLQFGAVSGLLLGTAAFFVGFGARLVTDWYGSRAIAPT
jgi:hypothetical protein